MASNNDITSAISSAETLALTPAQMVSLLDRLIAEAIVDNKIVVSYSINGRTVQRSLSEARTLRQYYQEQAMAARGSVQAAGGEFVAE